MTELIFKEFEGDGEGGLEELQGNFSTFLELARSHSQNEELHWKDTLVALIPKADFEMYDRAVFHFTGGPLKVVLDGEWYDPPLLISKMLVKADGYWECVGS